MIRLLVTAYSADDLRMSALISGITPPIIITAPPSCRIRRTFDSVSFALRMMKRPRPANPMATIMGHTRTNQCSRPRYVTRSPEIRLLLTYAIWRRSLFRWRGFGGWRRRVSCTDLDFLSGVHLRLQIHLGINHDASSNRHIRDRCRFFILEILCRFLQRHDDGFAVLVLDGDGILADCSHSTHQMSRIPVRKQQRRK